MAGLPSAGVLVAGWLVLGACHPVPEICTPMCQAAADRYGECLKDWGTDWPAAGYTDRADFLEACDVWAWQQQELALDAGHPDALQAACHERHARLSTGTCQDFLDMEWHAPVHPIR